MKKKVYLSIFVSVILAKFVAASGSIFGEQLEKHLKNETIKAALDGRTIADLSKEEAALLMRSPEFARKLVTVEKQVSGKYWWLVGVNLAVQFLLTLIICLACGKFVIHTVIKHSMVGQSV